MGKTAKPSHMYKFKKTKNKQNKFGLINYSSFPDHFEFIGKLPDIFL